MISLAQFFMGRDTAYAADLTDVIVGNSGVTVTRANALLAAFGEPRVVNSGWRPPSVNASTPGAAKFSRHMTGEAVDLEDGDGYLDEWCLAHQDVLVRVGLWQESPASTKGWAHVQIVPPRSGNRIFFP